MPGTEAPQHPADMSRTLALAQRLVGEAEAAGIAVASASVRPSSTYPSGRTIHIHAADEHLAAALAVALGLTRRSEWRGREVFSAEIDGTTVLTSGPVPPSPEDLCAACGRPLGEHARGHSPEPHTFVAEVAR